MRFGNEYKRMRAIHDYLRRCLFGVPITVLEAVDTEWDTITLTKIKQLMQDNIPLEDMTTVKLKEMGKLYKVRGWSRLTKADLVVELWHMHETKIGDSNKGLDRNVVSTVKAILDALSVRRELFDPFFSIDIWTSDAATIFQEIVSLSKVTQQSDTAAKKIKDKCRLLQRRYPSNFRFIYG